MYLAPPPNDSTFQSTVSMHINLLNSGDQVEATFGQQIRNYVFAPYKMVKDTRTGYETAQVTVTATPHTMSIMLLSSRGLRFVCSAHTDM